MTVKFTETKLRGADVIQLDPIEDDRGFFARSGVKKKLLKVVEL